MCAEERGKPVKPFGASYMLLPSLFFFCGLKTIFKFNSTVFALELEIAPLALIVGQVN